MTTMTLTKREDFPTCEAFPALSGKQSPLHLREAPGVHEHGRKNIELARRAGVTAFPWQCSEINAINATNVDGSWVHSDAVLICPRQNGKSLVVALVVLYRIFVLGQNVLFTAQQWETAKELWEQTWKIVKGRRFLSKHVVSKTCSQGRGTIFLANGGRVVFTTRSQDAGRGLTKVDLLIYDEAYNLTEGEMAALAFLVQAAEDPQVFFMTSAVHQDFPQHANGRVLSSMRAQALDEFDESDPIYFAEYAAPAGMDPMAEETWREANPSYGVIATAKKMKKIMRRMNTEEGRINFGVEALGWGSYFDESDADGFTPMVDLEDWSLAAKSPVSPSESCIGIEVSVDGQEVAFVAAVQDGERVFLSLSPLRVFDRVETVEALGRAVVNNDPWGAVIDPIGPASTLLGPIEDSGVEPTKLSGSKTSAAFELFMRMWAEGRIIHDGDARWLSAWEVAEEKPGKYRSWVRRREVTVLFAAAFAVWGLQELGVGNAEVEVKRKRRHVSSARAVKKQRRLSEMSF